MKTLYLSVLAVLMLIFAPPSSAQIFKIDSKSKTRGQITKNELTATINYEKVPNSENNFFVPKVQVKLRDKSVGNLQGTETLIPDALVQIAELDPGNPYPEVLLLVNASILSREVVQQVVEFTQTLLSQGKSVH